MELRQLQDAVPPLFHRRKIIAQELGTPSARRGAGLNLQAAERRAVGGGVDRPSVQGELPDGRQVAVKVRRPNILDDRARPLPPRPLTPLQTRVSNAARGVPTYPDDIQLATDLVDEWCAAQFWRNSVAIRRAIL